MSSMPVFPWLSRLVRGLASSPAPIEMPSGRIFRVKRIDAQSVRALRRAQDCPRPSGAALTLLISLLVETEAGRPLQVLEIAEMSFDDRRHLLAALLRGNASIYGIPTHYLPPLGMAMKNGAAETAASLEERASAFIDSYLVVEAMVSAQILTATRSSTA